ncbi:hypothetical protein [Staphylococcus xylosus]|uniref:hypothetical protein n=1 Tax=Staphylococcus xylosus TaxID=1288 RepID=UPI0003486724|nr:hypothetical protein [Staphylococcus xylosus]
MTEINHRYLTDKNGEIYFPKVHVEALLGIEDTDSENPFIEINNKISNLEQIIEDQQKVIEKNKKTAELHDKTLSDLIGDTGWIEYQVPPDMKNKAVNSGFKCAIREVRAGNDLIDKHFVVRSIRLNVSEITGASMQIAQLPTGFVTDNQSFIARQNGYRHPITIECLKNGKVMAYVHPDDQNKTNWVYQEFTWLE